MTTLGALLPAVKSALWTRLNAATAGGQPLAGVTVGDQILQGTAFPYISLGEFFPSDYSDKTSPGLSVEWWPRVWTRERGQTQLIALQGALMDLMHLQPLTLASGGQNWLARYVNGHTRVMPDNETRNAIEHYRIAVQV